jgi:hypothetical protein
LKIKGVWTSTTPRDEQVLALAAEIAALKAERLGLKPPKKVRDLSIKLLPPSERFKGEQAWKAVAPKMGRRM